MKKKRSDYQNKDNYLACIGIPVEQMTLMQLDYVLVYMHLHCRPYTGKQLIYVCKLIDMKTILEEQYIVDSNNYYLNVKIY